MSRRLAYGVACVCLQGVFWCQCCPPLSSAAALVLWCPQRGGRLERILGTGWCEGLGMLPLLRWCLVVSSLHLYKGRGSEGFGAPTDPDPNRLVNMLGEVGGGGGGIGVLRGFKKKSTPAPRCARALVFFGPPLGTTLQQKWQQQQQHKQQRKWVYIRHTAATAIQQFRHGPAAISDGPAFPNP